MAYIGKQPIVGNFVKLDAITTSATTTFNLTNGGVAYFPQTANNCIVSLNGVIQSPTSAYTISGSTIIFSDALTASDSIDFILVLGDVLNIGTPSDNTVSLAKLTATGTASSTTFLRGDNTWGTPGISWQSVQTSGFTAVAGRGYPCNTTSSAFTVTLPASPSAGDTIILLDYAGTFDTNVLTISPNGNKIEGGTGNQILTGDREGATLVYIDSTQGWLASSGINEGSDALEPNTYSIDFLVVAGGGSGGFGYMGAGGGGGGFRTSTQTVEKGTSITVTVGDGGASVTADNVGNNGSDSSISGSGLTTITSTGGGGGGTSGGAVLAGKNGGSGGGSGATNLSGSGIGLGNTPSTSPSQGNNGGLGFDGTIACTLSGGGGGAGAVGGNSGQNCATPTAGNGGNGSSSSITGSSVTYAGGGGGQTNQNPYTGGTGGTGGGGDGGKYNSPATAGVAGTVNLGGGGGGSSSTSSGAGGKGVVILSMLTTKYSGTSTGSPTVTTSGSNTILKFTGSGSYTA